MRFLKTYLLGSLLLAGIACFTPALHAQINTNGETKFFGLTGKGTRFVFVVDCSASMTGPPLAAAKREMLAALGNLKRTNQFQIVFYNERSRSLPRMAFADENGLADARTFVEGMTATGGTDHLQALQAAKRLGPDVIFFLTDAGDPGISGRDLKKIREDNVATIHVIDIASEKAGETKSLRQLAEENRGEYKRVDPSNLKPE